MPEPERPLTMVAAGNAFEVLDGFRTGWPREPEARARERCRGADPLDGLLWVGPDEGEPGSERADGRMVLFNADGSRAETCGNGLRCAAKLLREREYAGRDLLRIRTDSGIARAEVTWVAARIRAVRVELPPPRIEARLARLELDEGIVEATLVRTGNPHCVLFGDERLLDRLPRLGPALERHERFPERTNVELVWLPRPTEARVRVWERGVGETASCGSGACAVAVAAVATARGRSPLGVRMPGGALRVEWDGRGPVSSRGPVDELVGAARP